MLSQGVHPRPLALPCHSQLHFQLHVSCRIRRPLTVASSKQALTEHPSTAAREHTTSQSQNNISVLTKHEYRRNVGICLVNRQGLVLAGRRCDDTEGTWQMPQGGIDPLENPMTAAIRELKEETGVSSARIIAQIDRWLDYDFPTKCWSQFTGSWVKYRGQTQKWLLLHFYGDESEIDLGHSDQQEFSEYAWMPIERLPHEVVDFKRHVYREVAQEFGPIISRRMASSARSADEWTM